MKISRRDFLKYCISSAAILGLSDSILGKLELAFANGGPQVIWLSAASDTGCSISLSNLISTSGPKDITDLLVNVINLDYHPNLMGAAGDLAVSTLRNIQAGSYILAVEGGIPTAFGGNSCILWNENGANVTALAAVRDLASKSIANLAIGTCASFGGVAAASPNPTQVQSLSAAIGKPTINIPGCPTHPDWVVSVIAQLIAGTTPALDSSGRPSALFSRTVHDQCPREEDSGASTFGRTGCLRSLGCKGPSTRADCPSRLWNNKVSTCINANANCIGCTESNFPSGALFTVATTTTIPTQKVLAVTSATWNASSQAFTAAGTGKIGSQAVIKDTAGNLIASTMIKRDGTWSVSKTGVAQAPSTVVVSSNGTSVNANVTGGTGTPFALNSAAYNSGTNQITIAGTGTAGAVVAVSAGGTSLGNATIATNGSWTLTATSPSPVPTSISAVSNGVTLTASVTGIPTGTAFAVSSAAYTASSNQLTVSGTGTAGATVAISAGGASLGSATIASNGSWTRTVTSPSPVPASISAVCNGVTVTANVTGIPTGTAFAVSSAAYAASSNQLTVAGTGTSGATVTVRTASGTQIGTATITSGGSWTLTATSPSPVPTSISAVCNGVTLTANVTGIPAGTAFAVSSAAYAASSNQLTVAGTGTSGATVTVRTASGTQIGTATITSGGSWTLAATSPSPVPTSISAVCNGVTLTANVTGIPAGTAFAVSSAAYTASTNRLTVAGTGTSGATVTVRTASGTQIGTATITSGGSWTLTATSPSPVPASISAVCNGVTLTANVTGIPTSTQTLTITSATYDRNRNRLSVAGRGTPSERVRIYNASSGSLLGTTTVTSNSTWSRTMSMYRAPSTIRVTSDGKTAQRNVTVLSSDHDD